MICLIVVEAVLIVLTAPVPVKVRVHLSDEGFYMAASVEVLKIRLATVRAEIAKDRVRLRINGKDGESYSPKIKVPKNENVLRAVSVARRERMVKTGLLSVYVGGEDCAQGALLWGACAVVGDFLPPRARKRVFWDRESSRLSLDAMVKIRASALQTVKILFALLKKSD